MSQRMLTYKSANDVCSGTRRMSDPPILSFAEEIQQVIYYFRIGFYFAWNVLYLKTTH